MRVSMGFLPENISDGKLCHLLQYSFSLVEPIWKIQNNNVRTELEFLEICLDCDWTW